MKKAFYISLLFSCLLIILSGCNNSSSINEPDNTIKGSGRLITQERNVSECTGINLRYAGNVYIKQDSVQSIMVEADDNIINNVVTQSVDGILSAGLTNGSYSNVTVKIYVSLKSIESLTIQGAGNITTQNQIISNSLECIINGAGDIYLVGSGNSLYCIINGAGNINAFDFEAGSCRVKIVGTGNCYVHAKESLAALITGVGNIIYAGDPANVSSSVTGVGNITSR
ncbi:MAG: DUF2807 domain-containing protein [Ignavibacteriaceae bacterium]